MICAAGSAASCGACRPKPEAAVEHPDTTAGESHFTVRADDRIRTGDVRKTLDAESFPAFAKWTYKEPQGRQRWVCRHLVLPLGKTHAQSGAWSLDGLRLFHSPRSTSAGDYP